MLDVSPGTMTGLLRGRRSVRVFLPNPIPRETLDDVLRAALWAPSPHHSQPWRLTVLTDEARIRLATAMANRLANELRADGVDLDTIDRQTTRSRERISNAPAVVLVSLVREGLAHIDEPRRDALEWEMAVQSVGALLQSLFLAAHAEGIGSCWMAAPMYCPDVVRESLGLPEAFTPQALALLGFPAHPGKLRERRSWSEMVHYL
jgi:coenzyme F420-0:L-glutamate ligase/coenzyme F420-1:gamma-L-glutamate ligase